jgi:hypothetical protein
VGGRPGGLGDRLARARSPDVLDARGDEAHLARTELLTLIISGVRMPISSISWFAPACIMRILVSSRSVPSTMRIELMTPRYWS